MLELKCNEIVLNDNVKQDHQRLRHIFYTLFRKTPIDQLSNLQD